MLRCSSWCHVAAQSVLCPAGLLGGDISPLPLIQVRHESECDFAVVQVVLHIVAQDILLLMASLLLGAVLQARDFQQWA